jgi:hypothetical protein
VDIDGELTGNAHRYWTEGSRKWDLRSGYRRLEEMGLEERVPGEKETWRSTPLGRELRSDLLMVFLGLWDEWEVPEILEHYGVIDDLECESLWDLLGAGHDPETVLKRYVLQAYFAHYKRPKLLN